MAAIVKIHYYGHHEYICEHLHIQKCLFGDSVHVCQIWCFYQKVTIFLLSHYTDRMQKNILPDCYNRGRPILNGNS